MVELVTKSGWKFNYSSSVIIGDKCYDMEELNEPQKLFVRGKLQEQGLNAAFAGKAVFKAKGLPTFEVAFPDHYRDD